MKQSAATDKPVALVLGGTSPHVELIRNLQRRGYHVVLVDYLKNPPAKEVADEHVIESTLDNAKVLELAQQRSAQLVISACIDQANLTACFVSEKLGLPAPYGYETALSVTNKLKMKNLLRDNDIATSKFIQIKQLGNWRRQELKFPVIVKPVDSNSSKGVRKACDDAELGKFLADAMAISRSGEAIVEEFIEGVEIGIDCYVKDGKAMILMTKERRKIPTLSDRAQQIYGCFWPADLAAPHQGLLQKMADRIAEVFKLTNSPLMIQAIVRESGIDVIEFGARFGGGESYRIIKLCTGLDVIDISVDCFLGREVSLKHHAPEGYFADNFIYTKGGVFGRLHCDERVLSAGIVEYLYSYKTMGVEVGAEMTSNNRVGVFAVRSPTKEGLIAKIKEVTDALEVFDMKGEPMMRRDIYR